MTTEEYNERHLTCHRCEATDKSIGGTVEVAERYSYGYYAGVYCEDCAYAGYNDHCGLPSPCLCMSCDAIRDVLQFEGDKLPEERKESLHAALDSHKRGRQGDVRTLHEFEAGGWSAIEGEA